MVSRVFGIRRSRLALPNPPGQDDLTQRRHGNTWTTLLFLEDDLRKRGLAGRSSTVGRDKRVIREYIQRQEQEDRRFDQLRLL
jgi:hypothetical protein